MSIRQETDGPFLFQARDLNVESVGDGVAHTLAHFERWRDEHPDLVAEHVDSYTRQLDEIGTCPRWSLRIGPWPRRSTAAEQRRAARELAYFTAFNLGQDPQPSTLDALRADLGGRLPRTTDIVRGLQGCRSVREVGERLVRNIPVLEELPEMSWLVERFEQLHRILPEKVLRAGGMGKAVRATAGVLAVGGYDTLDTDARTRREHLSRILPGAYALGAAYVIVDDTFQDLPGDGLSPEDRRWCHRAVLRGLGTGEPVETSGMPDHPLAEELHDLYHLVLRTHPFDEHRDLYAAAEAMYLAQHRDSAREIDQGRTGGGLRSVYPDVFCKAGMSRVVATMLGRRNPQEKYWSRCLNTVFVGQLRDDLRDRRQDTVAGRLTPFTYPPDPAGPDPLVDVFAYDAYVVHEIFDGNPAVEDALTYFGAVKLARHVASDPRETVELLERYESTPEIICFLLAASGMSARDIARCEPADTQMKLACGKALRHRTPSQTEARTFVADRLDHINEVINRYLSEKGVAGLHRIVAYTLNAPGKRLRPALGLMLAAELDVDAESVEPIIVACELFHTASLIFDDLPAQDNAAVRRGRATAHTVFDEGSVQLAAVSMISSGFGMLTRLTDRYPADRVAQVIDYLGSVLGPERLCHGQDLDLRLARSDAPEATGEEILTMYELKTSTSIEAALVPLMMLQDRPAEEIAMVEQYARHAGIVFQIRDDVLDLVSSTAALGKDAGNDVGKVNVVRAFGLEEAERIMRQNLDDALDCCAKLPFDTHLLEGIVTHFAQRNR